MTLLAIIILLISFVGCSVRLPQSSNSTENNDMFGFLKKVKNEVRNIPDLDEVLKSLVKNEINVTLCEYQSDGDITRSKIGGKPAVPADFVWPRFEGENFNGEKANRPLSFLCQINLDETAPFDKESLLPQKGLLLFFYELDTMRWGYDPQDRGCSRVFYFEDTETLEFMDFPQDLIEDYQVKEYGIDFDSEDSYPSYEELECHSDIKCDWDEYDEYLEKADYETDSERHKLLGYANVIQNEMLTECERTARGIFCGDAKSYQNTPDTVKADIQKSAAEWNLLFQMASIQADDYELMFGDVGNLYFYIRKEDLKEKRFENAWLVLQCG